ncbi:Hypothetical protein R9X50_00201500 [Acrodontium crateriforme]|uniref:Uncharacterized protein n=1 Tax=Acrodontium crateriforme TaxID=150365 RepID=A0AAQ3R8N1_9PEZI|nr:Hypothetical protein R9X50_00201500 [Acrodontium crateriforme]
MPHQSIIPAAALSTQGVLLLATGLIALFNPEEFIKGTNDSITGDSSQLMLSLSMLGLSLGTSYIVASTYKPLHKRALLANIPLRALATYVFWKKAPNVAIYEAAWGVANAVASIFAA